MGWDGMRLGDVQIECEYGRNPACGWENGTLYSSMGTTATTQYLITPTHYLLVATTHEYTKNTDIETGHPCTPPATSQLVPAQDTTIFGLRFFPHGQCILGYSVPVPHGPWARSRNPPEILESWGWGSGAAPSHALENRPSNTCTHLGGFDRRCPVRSVRLRISMLHPVVGNSLKCKIKLDCRDVRWRAGGSPR